MYMDHYPHFKRPPPETMLVFPDLSEWGEFKKTFSYFGYESSLDESSGEEAPWDGSSRDSGFQSFGEESFGEESSEDEATGGL